MVMLTKISQVVQTYMIVRGPLLFPHHVGPISVGLQKCFYYNLCITILSRIISVIIIIIIWDPFPLVFKNVFYYNLCITILSRIISLIIIFIMWDSLSLVPKNVVYFICIFWLYQLDEISFKVIIIIIIIKSLSLSSSSSFQPAWWSSPPLPPPPFEFRSLSENIILKVEHFTKVFYFSYML